MPKSKGRNLTAKQQRFVDEYLVDQNATQAAIRAGYSAKTARQAGSENLSKPNIANAVAKRHEIAAERADWTAADRIAALKRISDSAEKDDPRVSVSAISEANKMQGSHSPYKIESKVSADVTVTDARSELEHLISRQSSSGTSQGSTRKLN